jgi:hypothetical protein
LQAFLVCWYMVLLPLWITLRKSNAHKSLQLIDAFTDYAAKIQFDSPQSSKNRGRLVRTLTSSSKVCNDYCNAAEFDA